MRIPTKHLQKAIQNIIEDRKKRGRSSPVYSETETEDEELYDEPPAIDAPVNNVIEVLPPQTDEFKAMERIAQREPVRHYRVEDMDMVLYDNRSANLYDWVDMKYFRKVYRLYRIMGDEYIIELGARVFTSLSTAASKRSMCSLMLLAYNLKDTDGDYVFENVDREHAGEHIDFNTIKEKTLSDDIALTGWNYTADCDDSEKANSFCYIACSFLRLYTKSSENFSNVPNHITEKFKNFFDYELAVVDFAPGSKVIDAIKSQFNTNGILKNTFYLLLYAGESTEAGKNLKDFLYGIHTAYTGLHSYTLFLRCMDSLDVSNIQLAAALDCAKFRRPIKALIQVFKNLVGCRFNDEKKKQMWKYARIFEPKFLHDLQTKNCITFSYALAYLFKKSSITEGRQNPLNIVQFKGISAYQRNMGALAAARAQAILGSDTMTKDMRVVSQLLSGKRKLHLHRT